MADLDIMENDSKQYIVVKIGNEQYGIDISYIDTIVRMQKITRVPKAQRHFKGVINLRGEIVPVMSIRLKMKLADDEFTNASRIIILKLEQKRKLKKKLSFFMIQPCRSLHCFIALTLSLKRKHKKILKRLHWPSMKRCALLARRKLDFMPIRRESS